MHQVDNPPMNTRRLGALASGLGAVVALVMLIVSLAASFDAFRAPALAQTNAGNAVVVSAQLPTTGQSITSGGSATVFSLQLPVGSACTGDSASSDYRVQSYMVPASVDPAMLTFGAQGPVPLGTGASYRQPLFTASTSQRFINQTTGVASSPGGGGQVPTLPGFNFAAVPFASGPGFLPPGTYNVGIACSRAAGAVLDKFWNVQMTFATDASDTPSGLTWSVGGGAGTTTTTTVAGGTTTTTVAGGTTTTTVAGGTTTTTVAGETTTTTTVAGETTTTVAGVTTTTAVPGGTSATVSPASPTAGGAYQVRFPNCTVGETITFQQAASTPASVTDVCEAPSALSSNSVAGFRRPLQAATGTASGSFTAAPTTPGTYTVTMTGTVSAPRTVTFTITGPSTPVGGGTGSNVATGGSPTGTNFGSAGTIPTTGSTTTEVVVWGVLLLIFGRMAILLGRKPRVLTGS